MEPTELPTEPYGKQMKLVLILVLVAIGIGVIMYFYFQGKKKGKETTNLNLSSPLGSDGNAPAASEAEIRIMVQNLHADMEGANLFGHDETTWNNFLALSDADVLKVNNRFNSEYQLESGESFVQWVQGESGDYAQTAMVRLKKLNLS